MPVAASEEGARVAVYNGPGVWATGRTAIEKMFEWMNASVTLVFPEDIKNGNLVNFDLLVIPGGNADPYNYYIGLDGAQKIRDFVSNGGAFIGICAGGYYACDYIIWEGTRYEYVLDLFPGYGVGPLEAIPWPTYNMTKIEMVNHTHPITAHEPEYEWILYYGGAEYFAYEGADVTVLGRYTVNDQNPAIVAFEYGLGRVFLIGPHPEIEEDSMRDGTGWGEWLDDRGSDWPLMYEAFKWLLWRSPEVRTFSVPWGGETYNITTFSNSTIKEINFNQTLKQISFNVNGPPGIGFCNVTIPKELLNSTSHEWIVMVDDPVNASVLDIVSNATHTSLYFTYSRGTQNIKIMGTWVVPEFPAAMGLPLFIIATLIAVILIRGFGRQRKEPTPFRLI
ncbi:MAG: BPL-N domain-containing protein [Candidatus Bathyarchaeaceae archaeon]